MASAWLVAVTLAAAAAKVAPAKPPEWSAFVAARQQACREFRATPDPKARAAVFAKYARSVRGAAYAHEAVPATVTGVEATSGGRVVVTVSTPFGECSNAEVWVLESVYHVEKGTDLYATLAELQEGDAVAVWLARVKPWHNELLPEASLCNSQWIVQFTRVERVGK